jgi:hypothetical protein
MAFLQNIAKGEAAMDLADAALQIAAEDDALGTGEPPRNGFLRQYAFGYWLAL